MVDADRATVPVSATMIRTDPLANLHHLAPPVRAWVELHVRSGRELTSERDSPSGGTGAAGGQSR